MLHRTITIAASRNSTPPPRLTECSGPRPQAGDGTRVAAQQVSSDVPRKVADAERRSGGGARPLHDEGLDASVLVGRLRGVGTGVPGPVLRMGEANAAGVLLWVQGLGSAAAAPPLRTDAAVPPCTGSLSMRQVYQACLPR